MIRIVFILVFVSVSMLSGVHGQERRTVYYGLNGPVKNYKRHSSGKLFEEKMFRKDSLLTYDISFKSLEESDTTSFQYNSRKDIVKEISKTYEIHYFYDQKNQLSREVKLAANNGFLLVADTIMDKYQIRPDLSHDIIETYSFDEKRKYLEREYYYEYFPNGRMSFQCSYNSKGISGNYTKAYRWEDKKGFHQLELTMNEKGDTIYKKSSPSGTGYELTFHGELSQITTLFSDTANHLRIRNDYDYDKNTCHESGSSNRKNWEYYLTEEDGKEKEHLSYKYLDSNYQSQTLEYQNDSLYRKTTRKLDQYGNLIEYEEFYYAHGEQRQRRETYTIEYY